MTLSLSTANLTWQEVSGSTAYAIFLDGKQVSTAGPKARGTKIFIPGGGEHTVSIVASPSGQRQDLTLSWKSSSTPPPPVHRYAPRSYNFTPSADARFCCSAQYGCTPDGTGWVDFQGVRYDDGGRDLGGRTRLEVPDLKGANSMDGREPCDEYIGPTGKKVGGAAGYPPLSFER